MDFTQDHFTEEDWRQFEEYDWTNDQQFNDGLREVLTISSNASQSDDQRRKIECQAKLFFFGRKVNKHTTYDEYLKRQRSSISDLVPDSSDTRNTNANTEANVELNSNEQEIARYPSSFSHIVELITTGQEIPGIKQIPNILLGDAAASNSVKAVRRKPWE
ncbi:uncharacterized protein V1516DRAFT_682504 [Lipomyces oligophaga]|uniref:uncharacterized protein n=1 Tax=Lipomyces oligophaga TaxID=45792 RepID=UPI0034CF8C5B